MYRALLTLLILVVASVSAHAGDVDCSATDVDQADSPNFAEKIANCEDEPVELWDPVTRKTFLSKRGKVVKTYEAFEESPQGKNVLKEQIVVPVNGELAGRHYAGTTFIIREFFRMNTEVGPVAAVTVIAEMNKQMAAYCVDGWEKEREWTERKGDGYYLHYQFTCSGEYKDD